MAIPKIQNNITNSIDAKQMTEKSAKDVDTKQSGLEVAINSKQLNNNQTDIDPRFIIKPSWKRWIVLFLFMLNSGNKAFQWIQLPASTQKLVYYYDVENYIINSTSSIFMMTYIFLTYPACFIIELIGIRKAVLIGSFATVLGSTIRCFSCNHEYGIYLLFAAQMTVSLGEQLIFSVPSRLASVWFPDHQVSTAVGLSIFGNQLGMALGFLLPQYLLNDAITKEQIGDSLFKLNTYVLIVSFAAFLGVVFLLEEAPKRVPGRARLKQLKQELSDKEGKKFEYKRELKSLYEQMKHIGKETNFMLLAVSYGINIGISYTVATLLNQMLEIDWPGQDIFVGIVGFTIIITGVIGSLFWGPLLDKTHKYLMTNIVMTVLALISFCVFAYVMVAIKSQIGCCIAAAIYGIFQTGFIVAGLDLAVELTYPVPELVSSSLMNVCPQILSIFAIFVGSFLVDNYGLLALFSFYIIMTLIALICQLNVKETLNRQEAVQAQQKLRASMMLQKGCRNQQEETKKNGSGFIQIELA